MHIVGGLLNLPGAGCCGAQGGRAVFPEAAPVFVPPAITHMCTSQHTSGSPGGDQTRAVWGAEEGEQSRWLCVRVSLLWKNAHWSCCFQSSRCATYQQRRFRLFHTHILKMFYYFLSMAQGMRGMLKRDSSTLSWSSNTDFQFLLTEGRGEIQPSCYKKIHV